MNAKKGELLEFSVEDWVYDVVVIGAGNAALTTALAARESGARVAVLEKGTQELRGGNTRFSGGLFRFYYSGPEDIRQLIDELGHGGAI